MRESAKLPAGNRGTTQEEGKESMYEQILYEVVDPYATITLNRPRTLNAWTERMAAELKHAVAQAEADKRVVAIIITGAGRGFCSGADLYVLRGITEGRTGSEIPPELAANPGDPTMGESFRGTYTYLMSVRKPIIAAINGPAAGMAIPIVLCCDLRFASDRASFTTAFSRRGLIAEWGSSWLLPRAVGPAHAMDLLVSSRRIDAQEAERMGLVNRVVPHAELLSVTQRYIEELASNCSPASMAIMKRQIYRDMMDSLAHAESEAFRLMVESFARPDFRQGVMSFLEKRPPHFPRL
jgi:enoyl-CoA hydratase/carnithine racemase